MALVEMFKAFFRKPFQEKYIPVFAALLMGVVLTAISHAVGSALVGLFLVFFQITVADAPLKKFIFYAYLLLGAATGASAVMFLLVGAFQACLVAASVAALPVSVVFTRKLETT